MISYQLLVTTLALLHQAVFATDLLGMLGIVVMLPISAFVTIIQVLPWKSIPAHSCE